jgi:hypothetical protein
METCRNGCSLPSLPPCVSPYQPLTGLDLYVYKYIYIYRCIYIYVDVNVFKNIFI